MNQFTHNSILTNKLTYAGVLCGLALMLIIELVANAVDTNRYALLANALVTITVGLAAGLLLKNSTDKPYVVSVFAALYTYGAYLLLSSAQLVHYALHLILVMIISVGLFYLSNGFFNKLYMGPTKKLIIAFGVFVVYLSACSMLGIYITRSLLT